MSRPATNYEMRSNSANGPLKPEKVPEKNAYTNVITKSKFSRPKHFFNDPSKPVVSLSKTLPPDLNYGSSLEEANHTTKKSSSLSNPTESNVSSISSSPKEKTNIQGLSNNKLEQFFACDLNQINPDDELITVENLCQKLLVNGYVQSYIDFYHLTHHIDPATFMSNFHNNDINPASSNLLTAASSPLPSISTTSSSSIYNKSFLVLLYNQLIKIEVSKRLSDTRVIYNTYEFLAYKFIELKEYDISIFFYNKYLETCLLTNDIKNELNCYFLLGKIYFIKKNYLKTLYYYEKYEKILLTYDLLNTSNGENNAHDYGIIYEELYNVLNVLGDEEYKKLEEKLKSEDNLAGANVDYSTVHNDRENLVEVEQNAALIYYLKALDCSQKCFKKTFEAEINGKIGLIYLNYYNNSLLALGYLQKKVNLAIDIGNVELRCYSNTLLAYTLDNLGQSEKALEELLLVKLLAEQSQNKVLLCKAYFSLGILYNKLCKYDLAVQTLEKHFSLVKTLINEQQQQLKNAPPPSTNTNISGASNYLAFASTSTSTLMNLSSNNSLNAYNKNNYTIKDLDLARSLLGISKGYLMNSNLILAIQDPASFNHLLDWKINRSDLSQHNKKKFEEEEEGEGEEKNI